MKLGEPQGTKMLRCPCQTPTTLASSRILKLIFIFSSTTEDKNHIKYFEQFKQGRLYYQPDMVGLMYLTMVM